MVMCVLVDQILDTEPWLPYLFPRVWFGVQGWIQEIPDGVAQDGWRSGGASHRETKIKAETDK